PLGLAGDLLIGALALELRHSVAANLVDRGEEPRPLVGGERREQECAALAPRFVDHRMQACAVWGRAETAVTAARTPFALDQPLLDEPLHRAARLAVVARQGMDQVCPIDRRIDADLRKHEGFESRQAGEPLEGERSAAAEVRAQRHQRRDDTRAVDRYPLCPPPLARLVLRLGRSALAASLRQLALLLVKRDGTVEENFDGGVEL